jgi:trans-aconitate 2-methyltransferase
MTAMGEGLREWDAKTYDRVADPQTRWGTSVVGWLELTGDERVLDAGCGSGRVTELLLERLPRGAVVALDRSREMLAQAKERLARFGDRVSFAEADLATPLPVDGLVDAVLSTATFHWVRDQDALFANLAAVMRSGAQLAAQCGGAGNVETVMAALRRLGRPSDVVFATPEETRRRLQRSGFTEIATWLHADPAGFDDDDAFRTFLRTVVLREQIASMTPAEGDAFVEEVVRLLPGRELDYVRLNIRARRG